ncbi:MAG: Hsp20/alpha crystallin family protein [Phycisphaerae bacterium]
MSTAMTVKKQEDKLARVERARDRRTYTPNVDIIETNDEFLVLADMPGVAPDAIDIQYEQGVLTMHGKVEPRQDEEKTNWLLREYGVGDFYRSFQLGEGIDCDRIEARLKDGVMELHLPKSEANKPRKIAVKAS